MIDYLTDRLLRDLPSSISGDQASILLVLVFLAGVVALSIKSLEIR